MPEQVELLRKTGQRGLLIISYKRLEKRLIEPQLLWQRQSMSPAHLAPPGSLQAKQLAAFMLSPHWGRVATGKKSLASMHAGSLRSCLALFDSVNCGLPGFSVREFSRQECWSVLANTGCHTLLEHCISCCPRHRL